MGSVTPTPTAEKRAALTLAVKKKSAPTAVKWAAHAYTNGWETTSSVYPGRSVKGGTNSSEMGSITPTPTGEEQRAAIFLAAV